MVKKGIHEGLKGESAMQADMLQGNAVNEQKPVKPIKPKPHFYAACLSSLQPIARELGYNLLIHGSMDRDMDLVAVPWVDDPKPELELIRAFDQCLRGLTSTGNYDHSMMPGGRSNYIIQLNRGMKWNNYLDEQWYLDISITPLVKK